MKPLRLSKIRVLVVDDAESSVGVTTDALNEYELIEVVGSARNGVEAVKLADELRPDIILMDIRMPEMDGIRATRRIKSAGNRARILILTSYDDDSMISEAMDAGAAGYLIKGTLVADIVSAIRATMPAAA